jgi:hypothetical protein
MYYAMLDSHGVSLVSYYLVALKLVATIYNL